MSSIRDRDYWATRYIESFIERSDIQFIADWVEENMEPIPTREQALAVAQEIFLDLEFIDINFHG